jgi:very-short-patch-repair endonuclease
MPLDSNRRLAAIAAAQDGVFTGADARSVGLRKDHIDRKVGQSWSPVYDGVYRIAGAPATWRSALRAAASAAGLGSAISHRSAGALYDLPGGRSDLVELTCVRWKRTIRGGLVVHESRRLDPRDIQLIDGIPVTRPERTVLDVASCFPSANYLELVIQAARRKRLITFTSTRETFDRHARRGLKGVRALREVLDRSDPESQPTESEMETLLLQSLREHLLPDPVVQFVVIDSAGQFVARADAAYPAARIVIEYDSRQEHSDEFQLARDAKRRNTLQACGYAVLSARHADLVGGGRELCSQIRTIIRRTDSEPA